MILRELRAESRAAWLRNRRCGASDVPAIEEVAGAFSTPWDVYDPDTSTSSTDQDRGHEWEPIGVYRYQVHTGRQVRRPRAWSTFVGPEPWASTSLDGIVDEDGPGVLEIKTDRFANDRWARHGTAIESWADVVRAMAADRPLVPPAYALQCQWSMWVVDAPWSDLCLIPPSYDPPRIFRVYRDDRLLADVVPRVRAWWQRHMIERVPPAVMPCDGYRRWYAKQPGTKTLAKASPQVEMIVRELDNARQQADAWAARKEAAAAMFTGLVGDGGGVVLSDGRECRIIRHSDGSKAYPKIFEQSKKRRKDVSL